MKKNVGSVLALYPTPLVIVGTIVDGKPNWTLVGHLGIIGHDRVMKPLGHRAEGKQFRLHQRENVLRVLGFCSLQVQKI